MLHINNFAFAGFSTSLMNVFIHKQISHIAEWERLISAVTHSLVFSFWRVTLFQKRWLTAHGVISATSVLLPFFCFLSSFSPVYLAGWQSEKQEWAGWRDARGGLPCALDAGKSKHIFTFHLRFGTFASDTKKKEIRKSSLKTGRCCWATSRCWKGPKYTEAHCYLFECEHTYAYILLTTM